MRHGEVPEPVAKPTFEGVRLLRSEVPYRARRRMFRKLPYGAVPGLFPACRDSNDPRTIEDSVLQRIGVDLPVPDPDLLEELQIFVRRWLERNLRPLGPCGLMSFEEWVAQTPYPERRRDELRQLYLSLRGKLPSRKQSSRIACFMKTEPSELVEGKGAKYGRLIMSRSDWAKVTMGPAMASIERQVYDVARPDGGIYFIKHVPVPERYLHVNALKKTGYTYVATDYTSFEASFSSPVMRVVECQLYRYMLGDTPLSKWIEETLCGRNELVLRSGFRYSVHGRRMSGDMCTSLGNGFTNLMLMLFMSSKFDMGVTGLVEGDDGIFAARYVPPKLQSMLLALGFDVKLNPVDDPSSAGFCGIVAADSGNIKDPKRFFTSFGWTSSCIDAGPEVMRQLLAAKALSAQYELPNCPLIRPAADRALKFSAGAKPRYSEDGYHRPPPCCPIPFNPTMETRALFARLYSVSVVEQLEIEARILSTSDLSTLEHVFKDVRLYHHFESRYVGP